MALIEQFLLREAYETTKVQINYRLEGESIDLAQELADELGASKSEILRTATNFGLATMQAEWSEAQVHADRVNKEKK